MNNQDKTIDIASPRKTQKEHDDETVRIASPHETAHPATASADTLGLIEKSYLGVTLKDRYQIERELGRGGVGVVYLALDKQLMSRPVVVKVLLEQSSEYEWFKKKFSQEMEALARLDHPGIVGVFDAGQMPDGKPYLVMQYIEGVSLRSLIAAHGMALDRVASIIRQTAHALSAAHDKGIYHRDLKPENIMLQRLGEDDYQVKLIDFGIATVKDSQLVANTETTTVAGTTHYMAPEQLMGKPAASSDIYALGVIAYEMVTGKRPFTPSTPYQLLGLQQQGVEVKPGEIRPELPQAAEECILKALSFDPPDRHHRARDLGEELARALTSQVVLPHGGTQRLTEAEATAKLPSTHETDELRKGRVTALASSVAVVEEAQPATVKKNMRAYVAVAAAVLALAVAVALYVGLSRKPLPPAVAAAPTPALTTIEFNDEFLNLNRWTPPASGWTILTREGQGRLQVENQQAIGYANGLNYADFEMSFHLKLARAAGAAWALRARDQNNYYLFYLSGPDGQYQNRFLIYVVRDGKFNPTVFDQSIPVVAPLKANGQYQIDIKAEGNRFTHKITSSETGEEYNLGLYTDPVGTFTSGSIGFRAIAIEKFWVDDLFVRPPGIQVPR
jgi:predicted Ser/Thr protein kinase